MRMHGHGAHDDMSYVQKELLEEWHGRDPIDRYASRLGGKHGFTEQEIEEIRRGWTKRSSRAPARRSTP